MFAGTPPDFAFGFAFGAVAGAIVGTIICLGLGSPNKNDWIEYVKRGYVIEGGQVFYVDIGPTVDAAVRKGPASK